MLEWITQINNAVNGVVWGPAGLALLFGTGLIMSVRTGFFQFRKMGYWLRHTIGAIFTNKDVTAHTSKEDMAISQFQSMCTALAGTIGTGNIVGVATAIVSGGPGAIFWMWVMALLGMMTSFSENVLGVYYRRKNPAGEWSGGAMYYLTDGLGAKKGCKQLGKVLAVLFACFCILASFGIGNMSQLNSIAGNMNAAFGVPTIVTGLALMVVTALIVIGGLKRVAAVTEKLVPVMAVFYIIGALVIVAMHAGNIPAAFGAIFKGAFNLQAAGGGALGYGISQTITWGFKRGAFSNEAGLGSAVMVNSASNVKEPVHQGMWGVFEVFADTIVVCTLTALVILTTGVVDLQSGAVLANVQDNALVGQAFTAAFGSFGPKFIAISILLFAYSTTLGWSHYGTKAVEYLFGTTGSRIYKVVFVGMRCQSGILPGIALYRQMCLFCWYLRCSCKLCLCHSRNGIGRCSSLHEANRIVDLLLNLQAQHSLLNGNQRIVAVRCKDMRRHCCMCLIILQIGRAVFFIAAHDKAYIFLKRNPCIPNGFHRIQDSNGRPFIIDAASAE